MSKITLGRIRYDIGGARGLVWQAQDMLELDGSDSSVEMAKLKLQEAVKLIHESIADLDGLIQDRAMLLANGAFIGSPDLNKANGIDPEVADLCPQFGVPQDGPGYGEEPWWA